MGVPGASRHESRAKTTTGIYVGGSPGFTLTPRLRGRYPVASIIGRPVRFALALQLGGWQVVDGRLPLDLCDVERSVAQLREQMPGQLFVVRAMPDHAPLVEGDIFPFVAAQQLRPLSASISLPVRPSEKPEKR